MKPLMPYNSARGQAFDLVIAQWTPEQVLGFAAYVAGYSADFALDYELKERGYKAPVDEEFVNDLPAQRAELDRWAGDDGPGYDDFDPKADYGVTR